MRRCVLQGRFETGPKVPAVSWFHATGGQETKEWRVQSEAHEQRYDRRLSWLGPVTSIVGALHPGIIECPNQPQSHTDNRDRGDRHAEQRSKRTSIKTSKQDIDSEPNR